jgi:hypothetical protein
VRYLTRQPVPIPLGCSPAMMSPSRWEQVIPAAFMKVPRGPPTAGAEPPNMRQAQRRSEVAGARAESAIWPPPNSIKRLAG